ncbi:MULTISPECIES: hypothetical protein [Aerosakkonema]|uniref:hypothetical protein n=1 Tax=Aerosakkonema TaxID=1246629 RepID=UPI0035BC7071
MTATAIRLTAAPQYEQAYIARSYRRISQLLNMTVSMAIPLARLQRLCDRQPTP